MELQQAIVSELGKQGWLSVQPSISQECIAKRAVETHQGKRYAEILPINRCVNGLCILKANFNSHGGENALRHFSAFIAEGDDVHQKVQQFHYGVQMAISKLISIH